MLQNELKRLRVVHGFTQQQMAEKLEIPLQELQQYETNERDLPLSLFEKLLKVLDAKLTLTLSDVQQQMAASASSFISRWEGKERQFPGWNVIASGGGVWILEKEFYLESLQKNILVGVSDECGIVFKRLDDEGNPVQPIDYINKEEYKASADLYDDYAYASEEMLYFYDSEIKGYQNTAVGKKLFPEDLMAVLHEASAMLIKG